MDEWHKADTMTDMTGTVGARTASSASSAIVVEAGRLDEAVHQAVADTPTPTLDGLLQQISNAANYSRLWMGVAAVLAAAGGRRGRSSAVDGLVSIAVTSAVVNQAAKRLSRRPRPQRAAEHKASATVTMPQSHSFPSGHAASAFAFATAVGSELPILTFPLHATAVLVAYSRVHNGVHYPSDVLVGGVIGSTLARLVTTAAERIRA
jgi:undecaprenyl-diphosphatase